MDSVEMGKKGGNTTKKLYGKEHFVKMVNTRWAKVKKAAATTSKTRQKKV